MNGEAKISTIETKSCDGDKKLKHLAQFAKKKCRTKEKHLMMIHPLNRVKNVTAAHFCILKLCITILLTSKNTTHRKRKKS